MHSLLGMVLEAALLGMALPLVLSYDDVDLLARMQRLEEKMDVILSKLGVVGSNFQITQNIERALPVSDQIRTRPHLKPLGSPIDRPEEFGMVGSAIWLLFIHEAWLFMQHSNVLLNPYLQRLDRQYGISLLKKRFYWVIAGVLAAYWSREVVSLGICRGFVTRRTQVDLMPAMVNVFFRFAALQA